MTSEEILQELTARFGDKISPVRSAGTGRAGEAGRSIAVIHRDHVLPILSYLKESPTLAFDLLVDVTVVDHLRLEDPVVRERFAVVYQLLSLRHNHRFQVKARVPEDDPTAPSVFDLWKSALWGEREAFDMYGIEFEGNPDMRRLLMPEDYPGFPLRKDYPLRGRGERDAFPQYSPRTEARVETNRK